MADVAEPGRHRQPRQQFYNAASGNTDIQAAQRYPEWSTSRCTHSLPSAWTSGGSQGSPTSRQSFPKRRSSRRPANRTHRARGRRLSRSSSAGLASLSQGKTSSVDWASLSGFPAAARAVRARPGTYVSATASAADRRSAWTASGFRYRR